MHTLEPWSLKDFVGTHEIMPRSVDPESDPVALLTMVDYSRSIACVNALAGVPDPAAFMAAVDSLIGFAESGGGNLPHEVWQHIGNLRSARGKH